MWKTAVAVRESTSANYPVRHRITLFAAAAATVTIALFFTLCVIVFSDVVGHGFLSWLIPAPRETQVTYPI